MNKLLIDTNILFYAIDEESQFYSRSRSLLEDTNQSLFTTSKNLTEFLTVMTKSSGYKLRTDLALDLLKNLIKQLEIIYPTSESFVTFLELVERYEPSGLKLHDFEIISIGLSNHISQVATFNRNDFEEIKEITLFTL